MNDDTGLDASALEKLRKIGGGAFAAEMVKIYFEHVPSRLAAAREAMSSGDLHAVAAAVHALKSTANHVGARRVHEIARQVEVLARAKEGEPVPELLDELEAAHRSASPGLEELQRELGK